MKIKLILIIVLFFGFTISLVNADSKYAKTDSHTLEKIKKKATFEMLVPHELPTNWTIEVKYPYPLDLTQPIDCVRLHFFNKDDTYMAGIEQFKANFQPIGRPGGYLWWIEGDTCIRMDSQVLIKDEMMKLAQSME